jgi:cellulase/cellobiase CelA1
MRAARSRCRSRIALLGLALGLGCRGEGEVFELAGGEPADGRCGLVVVEAAPALTVARLLTSDWESGSCYEFTITNTGAARAAWWVQLASDAAVVDRWNHTATDLGGGLSEWRGISESYNIELDPQGVAVVGACLEC